MTVSKMRPTDKPKAHREAVNRDRLRIQLRSLLRSRRVKSYRQAKSPPGWSQLRSRPAKSNKTSQCHYQLQDILHRACGSTAQSSDSASALELSKYNHFGETYVLDIDEWDTIDIYDWRLRPMPAAEAPIDAKSRAQALLPWQCQQRPTPRYELQEWRSLEHGFS